MNVSAGRSHTKRFICLVLFFDAMGVGLILPVMPDLIQKLSDRPVEDAARIGGYLLLCFAGMQFLCAPLLGALSDRFGRRPVLLLALLGFSADYFLMAIAPTLGWLFAARLVSGVFGATYPAATAAMADISSPEQRAANFGLVGASIGLGFVVGPAFGGLLGEYGTRLPFLASGVLTLAACLYGYVTFPEPLAPEHRRPFSLKRANPVGNLAALSAYPSILGAFAALFCIQLASQSYASVWSFFAIETVGWTPLAVGLSATAYGVMMAAVQGGLTGRAVARFGETRIICVSLVLGIVSYGFISQASTGAMIYGGVIIGGFAGMAFPTIQAMMSRQAPPNAQGELQGAVTSAYSLSAIIGPVLMTQLFSAYADETGLYFPGAPFLAAALLIGGALLIFTLYARDKPQLVGGVSRS